MLRKTIAVLLAVLLVSSAVAAPAAAASNNTTDSEPTGPDFLDSDNDGSIVDDVTPDFLGDLMNSLPVPDFVKGMFN